MEEEKRSRLSSQDTIEKDFPKKKEQLNSVDSENKDKDEKYNKEDKFSKVEFQDSKSAQTNKKFSIEEIQELKKDADLEFKLKNYKQAIRKYTLTIEAITTKFEEYYANKNEKDATDIIDNLGVPTYLNLSKSYYWEKDYKNATKISAKILDIQPNNVKAIYLRFKGNIELNELETAEKDLESLKKLMSDSDELKDLIGIYNEKKNLAKINEMKMFRKMIKSRASEPNNNKEEGITFLMTAIYFFISQFFFLVSYSTTLAKKTVIDIYTSIISFFFGIFMICKNTAVEITLFIISCINLVVTFPFVLIYNKIKEIGIKQDSKKT